MKTMVKGLTVAMIMVALAGCSGMFGPEAKDDGEATLSLNVHGLAGVDSSDGAVEAQSAGGELAPQAIDPSGIVSAEVTVDALNFSSAVTETVSLTSGSGTSTLTSLPIGANRVISVVGQDANGNPVAGGEMYATVDLYPGTNSVTVNWDTTPRGRVFAELLAQDRSNGTDYSATVNAAAVQTKIEGVVTSNGLGHPNVVDAVALAGDIISNSGSIPSTDSFVRPTGSVSVDITGTGSNAGWPVELTVTDPTSQPIAVTGDGAYTIDEVLPGDWNIVLSINNGAYQVSWNLDTVSDGGVTTSADGGNLDLEGPWDLSGSLTTGLQFGEGTVPVQELTVGNNVVFLPEGYETPSSQPSGDFQGMAVLTGSGNVAGFAAQTDAGSATNASEVVGNDETTIAGDTSIAGISNVGSNTQGDIYTAQYVLTYGSTVEPIEVSNRLLELIGLSQAGGSVSGLPAGVSATQTDTFRFVLTVKYNTSGEVVKTVAVTPDSSYTTYEAEISAFVDGTNIAAAGTVRATTQDTFTAQSGPTVADFLFVVDDSGSMSQEQTAVSQAASDFWDELSSTGLDFNVGVISTGSTYQLQGSGFTADRTTFESEVVLGTSGSTTETGIYNAEQALSPGGPVEIAGYPRPGASMSVIVLSDEDSQYTSRSSGSFDPNSNLFVDNGYRFYSIIDTSYAGQYDDLSNATGGEIASISDLNVFPQIMDNIAAAAGGAASMYQLTQGGVINATIQVTVDGAVVPKSTSDGWSYLSSSNAVVFYGSAVPSGGQNVAVSYEWKQ